MKKFKAGIFGLGVVGSGVIKALQQDLNFGISIEKVAVKNIGKKRDVALPANVITDDATEILENSDIEIIVELINDPEEAFEIVKRAFEKGKSVVSANKKMVAIYHREILKLRDQYGVKFFYEGAVCGSVPILRLLDQHFKLDKVKSLKAIANGTCNFILSKMVGEDQNYDLSLKEAQDLGFAELDPHSDVSGEDTRFKLSIMIFHAFGIFVHPKEIPLEGIDFLDEKVVLFAQQHQLKIKLVGEAQLVNDQIVAKVEPQLVNDAHDFYNIEREFNGVLIDAKYAGQQFFKGKGAGSFPTALAVLSNLKDIQYDLSIEENLNNSNIHYTDKTATSIYFVSGFEPNERLESLSILSKEGDAYIIKGSFAQFKILKRNSPHLYWVQIHEKIYQEIKNLEVLI